jgi:hypothetical protein
MTTIAFRDGVMASDSCWTALDGVQVVSAVKINRLASGALLGQAGDNDSREVVELLNRVDCRGKLPKRSALLRIKVDCSALLAFPSGRVYQVETSSREEIPEDADIGIWEVNRGFAAVGTGSHLALGAMAHGATAEQAVVIACGFDIHSRLPAHGWVLRP